MSSSLFAFYNILSMKEASPDLSYTDRIRSWVNTKAHGGTHRSSRRPDPNLNPNSNILPLSNPPTTSSAQSQPVIQLEAPSDSYNKEGSQYSYNYPHHHHNGNQSSTNHGGSTDPNILLQQQQDKSSNSSGSSNNNNNRHNATLHINTEAPSRRASASPRTGSVVDVGTRGGLPAAASPQLAGQGPVLDAGGDAEEHEKNQNKKTIPVRFYETGKKVLLHSKINLLLVFVPVGIIVRQIPNASPGLIFAMNAIAIIPLAGLLSHATESVARKLGDSLGALLNVTFGNAVELIIL